MKVTPYSENEMDVTMKRHSDVNIKSSIFNELDLGKSFIYTQPKIRTFGFRSTRGSSKSNNITKRKRNRRAGDGMS